MTFLKQFMKWSYASLYTILSECSCKWLIFLFSTLHWTSKLVDSSQTRLQWRISLGLSFVLESYNFTTLLKQTISYQRFLHKFEMRSSKDNALSICTPSIFFFFIRLPNSCFTNFWTFLFVPSIKEMTLIFIQFVIIVLKPLNC